VLTDVYWQAVKSQSVINPYQLLMLLVTTQNKSKIHGKITDFI